MEATDSKEDQTFRMSSGDESFVDPGKQIQEVGTTKHLRDVWKGSRN
jgi:hypothetical protein